MKNNQLTNNPLKTKLLSVVIPAYNKEKTIKSDLLEIQKTLFEGLPAGYDFEIICVDDGSSDETYRVAKKVEGGRITVYGYKNNMGKGYAVRFGMERSHGDLVSFLDAGRDISPKGIMMLMSHLEWYEADVVVGSKRHPVSRVNYPVIRHILSIGYHTIVDILFGLNLTDTQSGLKIFRSEVIKKILPKLVVNRYAMDIEMLAVSKLMGFTRIFEAPIEVHFDSETSSVSWNTAMKMFWDTLGVFYRLRILHYYDKRQSA